MEKKIEEYYGIIYKQKEGSYPGELSIPLDNIDVSTLILIPVKEYNESIYLEIEELLIKTISKKIKGVNDVSNR